MEVGGEMGIEMDTGLRESAVLLGMFALSSCEYSKGQTTITTTRHFNTLLFDTRARACDFTSEVSSKSRYHACSPGSGNQGINLHSGAFHTPLDVSLLA